MRLSKLRFWAWWDLSYTRPSPEGATNRAGILCAMIAFDCRQQKPDRKRLHYKGDDFPWRIRCKHCRTAGWFHNAVDIPGSPCLSSWHVAFILLLPRRLLDACMHQDCDQAANGGGECQPNLSHWLASQWPGLCYMSPLPAPESGWY